MMDCSRFSDLLSDYLEGSLSPPLMQAMKDHREKCPACQRELTLESRLNEALRAGKIKEPPADFTDRLLEKLAKVPVYPISEKIPIINVVTAVVAILVLGGLLFFGVHRLLNFSNIVLLANHKFIGFAADLSDGLYNFFWNFSQQIQLLPGFFGSLVFAVIIIPLFLGWGVWETVKALRD